MDPKRRKAYPLSIKMKIINFILEGKTRSDICRELNLAHSTVCSIWKDRERLSNAYESKSPGVMRLRAPVRENMHKELLKWYSEVWNLYGEPPKHQTMKKKANEIAEKLGDTDFTCTDSWLKKFRTRYRDHFMDKTVFGNDPKTPSSEVENSIIEPAVIIKEEPIDCDDDNSWAQASSSSALAPIKEDPTLSDGGADSSDSPTNSREESFRTDLVFSLEILGKDTAAASTSSDPGVVVQDHAKSDPQEVCTTSDPKVVAKVPTVPIMSVIPVANRSCSKSTGHSANRLHGDETVYSAGNVDLESISTSESSRPRDQFDVYGEYIASKLRQLDWKSCAFVQKAIGDLIFDAEMGAYLGKTNQTT